MADSEKIRSSKWVLPIIVLTSIAMICGTVLIITFKTEIKERVAESRAEREAKIVEEKRKARPFLQFSKEDKTRLLARQGLTSITEKPIGNVPFAWLGKPLPTPLPKGCVPEEKPYIESITLIWREKGYDGFYTFDLKERKVITSNPFFKSLIIFTKKGEIKRLRMILEVEAEHKNDNPFSILKKEYEALGYEYAEKFGLPIEDIFELDKGYEDNEENAFKYDRGNAHRTYKAKEGKVEISLDHNSITIDYFLQEESIEKQ